MPAQSKHDDLDVLMNEGQAAAFLGFTPRALQAWRYRGEGPAFIKISARAVRYRRRDLIEWSDKHRQTSTSKQDVPNGND